MIHRDVIVFEKLRFRNIFRPHGNKKPAFSNSSGLKSVFEKLRFSRRISVDGRHNRRNEETFSNSSGLKSVVEKLRFPDGLVWMVGLTVEITLRFQISPVYRAFSKSSVFVLD